jgi:carboxyl-terminal processing protease
MPFSKVRSLVVVLTLMLLTGGIGYNLGQKHPVSASINQPVINTATPGSQSVDFALFWDVWGRLHRSYIDAASIDNQKMVYGAISGMVASLEDPYTSFLPPKENQNFKDDMSGSFEGIGAQLGLKDGRIIVISPLKGSPALNAGIKPGDSILKVNGSSTDGWTVEQAVQKIRGEKGTKVTLNILHDGSAEPGDIAITRDQIIIPAIESWVRTPDKIESITQVKEPDVTKLSGTVGYIHLSRFGDRLSNEWTEAVNDILEQNRKQPLRGIVFDLRNNPGGYLDGSVFIASEFLRDGLVVSQQNSDGSKLDYKVNRKGQLLDIPLVVLINKGSASASEIVAGALKDQKRATLVGDVSFGKGSVQTPEDLPGGSSLHVTTGRWLTPSGVSISKKGITPDVLVKLDPSAEASADAQLSKAIELLLK